MQRFKNAIQMFGYVFNALTSRKAIRFYRFLFDVAHATALIGYLALIHGAKLSYKLGWELRSLFRFLAALIDTFVYQQQEPNPVYLLAGVEGAAVETPAEPDPWVTPPTLEALPALPFPVMSRIEPVLMLTPAVEAEAKVTRSARKPKAAKAPAEAKAKRGRKKAAA